MYSFVAYAPARGASGEVPIAVVDMTVRHALDWDLNVQPFIRKSHQIRADRWWSWVVLRQLFPLQQYLKGYRCRTYTIVTPNQDDDAVPAAMLLLIDRYPHVDPAEQGADSTFMWFLSTAPDEAMHAMGVARPPSLGLAVVDTALVHSSADGCDGRAWLHAATSGGDRLIDFYELSAGMIRLNPEAAMPAKVRRPNDGRFFYTTPDRAEQLLAALNSLR
jgi:hypothetical protein